MSRVVGFGVSVLKTEKTVKIGGNLTEEEARALKARLEAQVAGMCGGEWCVDVYQSGGRWLARAYPVRKEPGKRKWGRGYRKEGGNKGTPSTPTSS